MAAGRPSKYDPKFCEELIKHMSDGLSYRSFAGLIGVHNDTLYEWEQVHPEFSGAKKIGLEACCLFWERMGRAAAGGLAPGFNGTAFVWMTKNMLGWRDKKDIQISGGGGGPIQYQDLSEDEIKRRMKELSKESAAFDAIDLQSEDK